MEANTTEIVLRPDPILDGEDDWDHSLDDLRFLSLRRVLKLAGEISANTLYRWIRQGRFPAPVKLSPQFNAWPLEEVKKWRAQQTTATIYQTADQIKHIEEKKS